MIMIDLMSRVPIYEQIIEQLETFVLKGILDVGDQIPSVRNLSIQLSINPNTIQKAYSELVRTGIIDTVPGRGSFIAKEAKENLRNLQGNQLDELSNIVKKLALAGITKQEIVESINKVFLEKVGKGKEND